MRIKIFYDNTTFRLRGWRKIKKLVAKVISEEGKISGDLNFIVTDDESLKNINSQFLQHNYYTDVISFSNGNENEVSGEIYMSIDRIKINSVNYKVSLNDELIRIIVHGVLHLCGYNDGTVAEKRKMTRLEDMWLKNFESM